MNIIQKSLGFLAAWTPGLAASAATLISTADASLPTSATAGGLSASSWMTPNGQFIAFESDADNLISGPHRTGVVEVYLRDRTVGRLLCVSQSKELDDPGLGNSANSGSPSVSTNGQWIAFRSRSGTLISGVLSLPFTADQIFLHNTASNQNILVTSGLNSGGGDKDSRQPMVSANGQVVVFESAASNLVTGDTNAVADVFAYDVASGTLSLVSVNASGSGPANGASQLVDVSADGRYVLFTSKAGDVVTGCTNKQGEVFVRDLQQGVTLWASAGAAGFFTQGSPAIASQTPAMDASGQHVVYQAYNAANVFCLYANLQGTTQLVCSNAVTNIISDTNVVLWKSDLNCAAPQISADGQKVAYVAPSFSETSYLNQVYVWDAATGQATLASVATDGVSEANAFADRPVISADGSTVAFVSPASNLAAGATAGTLQVYARNLAAGVTRLVTVNLSGTGSSAGDFGMPQLSEDGSVVLFESEGTDLVVNDFNRAQDIFVRTATGVATECLTVRDAGMPGLTPNGPSYASARGLSSSGEQVAFTSLADNLAVGDANQALDVYWRDVSPGITRLVSSVNGVAGNSASYLPGLSGDGQAVYFGSAASDLDSANPLTYPSSYLRQLDATNCVLVSSNLTNSPYMNAPCWISADGQWAGFTAWRSCYVQNLASGDISSVALPSLIYFFSANILGSYGDVLAIASVYNYNYVTLSHLSDSTNSPTSFLCAGPWQSANGRWVVGISSSISASGNTLVIADLAGDTNSLLTLDGTVSHPQISDNGRWLAFQSSQLLAGNTNSQIYLYDRETGSNRLVSVGNAAGGGEADSRYPQISSDGRYVVYESQAFGLTEGIWFPGAGTMNVFVFDTLTGETDCLSASLFSPNMGNGASGRPIISRDGRTVVFASYASDLVLGDYNQTCDLFATRLPGALAPQISEITRDGDGFTIRWKAQAGTVYRLQYTTSLTNPQWQNVAGDVTAATSAGSKKNSLGTETDQRFYRVVVVQ